MEARARRAGDSGIDWLRTALPPSLLVAAMGILWAEAPSVRSACCATPWIVDVMFPLWASAFPPTRPGPIYTGITEASTGLAAGALLVVLTLVSYALLRAVSNRLERAPDVGTRVRTNEAPELGRPAREQRWPPVFRVAFTGAFASLYGVLVTLLGLSIVAYSDVGVIFTYYYEQLSFAGLGGVLIVLGVFLSLAGAELGLRVSRRRWFAVLFSTFSVVAVAAWFGRYAGIGGVILGTALIPALVSLWWDL